MVANIFTSSDVVVVSVSSSAGDVDPIFLDDIDAMFQRQTLDHMAHLAVSDQCRFHGVSLVKQNPLCRQPFTAELG